MTNETSFTDATSFSNNAVPQTVGAYLPQKREPAELSAGPDNVNPSEGVGEIYSAEDRKRVSDSYGKAWEKMSWFDRQRAMRCDSWYRDLQSGAVDEETVADGLFNDPEIKRVNDMEQKLVATLKDTMSKDLTSMSDDEAQGRYMAIVEADPRFGFKDDTDGSKMFGAEAEYGRGNLKRLLGVYSGVNPNGLYSREAQKWMESPEAVRIAEAKDRRGYFEAAKNLIGGDSDEDVEREQFEKVLAQNRAVQYAGLMAGLSPAAQEIVRQSLAKGEIDRRTVRFLDEDEREIALRAFQVGNPELDANWWLTQGLAQGYETTASMVRGTWMMLKNFGVGVSNSAAGTFAELDRYEREQALELQIRDAEKWKYKDNLTFGGKMLSGLLGSAPYMAAMTNPLTGTAAVLGAANDVYERAVANGADPSLAMAVALPAGVAIQAIEKLQWNGIFGKGLSEFAIRRMAISKIMERITKDPLRVTARRAGAATVEVLKTSATEDAEEVLQQLTEEVGVSLSTGDFNVREIVSECVDTAVESFPTTLGFGLLRVSGVGPALHRKFSRQSVLSSDFAEYVQGKNLALNAVTDKGGEKYLMGKPAGTPVITADLSEKPQGDGGQEAKQEQEQDGGEANEKSENANEKSENADKGPDADALKEKLLDDMRTKWKRSNAKNRINTLVSCGLDADHAAIIDEFFRMEEDFFADNPYFTYTTNGGEVNVFDIENLPQVMKGVKKVEVNEDGSHTLHLQLDENTVVPVKVERVDRSSLKTGANAEQFEKQVAQNYEKKNGEGSWAALDEDAKNVYRGLSTPGGFTHVTVGDTTIPYSAIVQLAKPDVAKGDAGAELWEVGHEIFHAATLVAEKMGILTSDDIAKMRKVFGEPKSAGYRFDEEGAADLYGKWLVGTADDSTGVFAKIRDLFTRIWNALNRKSGNEPAELNPEEIFKAIRRGNLRGISELVERESAIPDAERPATAARRQVADKVLSNKVESGAVRADISTYEQNILNAQESAARDNYMEELEQKVADYEAALRRDLEYNPWMSADELAKWRAEHPSQWANRASYEAYFNSHPGETPLLKWWYDHGRAIFNYALPEGDVARDWMIRYEKDPAMRAFIFGVGNAKAATSGYGSDTLLGELASVGVTTDNLEEVLDGFVSEKEKYDQWVADGAFTPEEVELATHYGSLDEVVADMKQAEVGKMRFSISQLYTGSAADYEKPSLLKVGTGEGSQVYGWGLYASNVRGVAEGYAAKDTRTKYTFDGKPIADARRYGHDYLLNGVVLRGKGKLRAFVAETLADNGGKEGALKFLNETNLPMKKSAIAEIEKNAERYGSGSGNLYEQTFFTNRAPGDESHLLSWYEPVSEENWNRIVTQGEKERGDDFLFMIDEQRTGGENASDIYNGLVRIFGSPQAASEFLARADIDGIKYPVDSYGGKTVKDGDKVGWNYVSFRDDNIRVDHKWVDGVQRFSISPTLREDVEAALNTDRSKSDVVKGNKRVLFCRTPEVLKAVGLNDANIYTKVHVIRKVSKDHELTADQIARFPELISSPAVVFDDYGTGLIVLTNEEAPDENGVLAPVAIVIRPDEEGNYIASAYSRKESSETKYVGLVKDGKILYFDKNKVANLSLRGEAQSSLITFNVGDNVITPEGITPRIIPQSGGSVKGGADGERRGSVTFNGRDAADVVAGLVAVKARRGERMTVNQVQKLLAQVGADTSLAGDILYRGQKSAGTVGEKLRGAAVDDSTFMELATDDAKKSRLLAFAEHVGEAGYKLGAEDERKVMELNAAKSAAVTAAIANAQGFAASQMENKYGFNLVESVANANRPQVNRAPGASNVSAEDGPGEVNGPGVTLTEMMEADEAAKAKRDAANAEVAAPESAAMADIRAKAARRADKIDAKYNLDGGKSPKQKAAEQGNAVGGAEGGEGGEGGGNAGGETAAPDRRKVKRDKLDFIRASDFLGFVEELVARETGKPDLFKQGKDGYNGTPADVRTLLKTAQFFLRKVATRLTYSRGREFIMRDIDDMTNATTLRGAEAAIMNMYSRVQDRLIPETQEQLVKRLEYMGRQIAEKGPVMSRGGDERDRKVRALVEEWWRNVKRYLRLSPEMIEHEKNRLREIIENREKAYPEDAGKSKAEVAVAQDLRYRMAVDLLNALTQYGGLINRTPGEIADRANEIIQQLKSSRAELENRREDEKIKARTVAETLRRAVVNPNAQRDNKRPTPGWVTRMFDSMMGILELRLRDLIRFSYGEVRTRAEESIQGIEDALALASQTYNVYKVNNQRDFTDMLKRIYGSSEDGMRRLSESLPEDVRKALVKQGTPDISRAWLLQRYVELCQTDDYARNIAANGRDGKWREAFDKAFKQFIDERDMAFLTWMRDWYRTNLRELNAKVLVPVSGIEQYSPGENYFPVKMLLPTRQGVDAKAKAWSPLPSWLTPRITNDYDFDEKTDIVSMWFSRMNESGASIAYAKAGLGLSDILLSPGLKDAVRDNHGDVALRRLVEHVTDIISGGGREIVNSDDSLAFADRLRAWQTNLTLSCNLVSAFKQMLSCPVYALRHDIDFGMVARFMTHVDMASIREMMASDGWKARYGSGFNEAISNAMRVNSERGGTVSTLLKTLYNAGFSVMEVGDSVPCLWVGQGLYRYFLARIRDQEGGAAKMTEEEIRQKAMARTWAIIEMTQQSKRTENLTAAQRGGPMGRFLYQFVSSPVQQLAFEVQAVREALAARGTPHAKEANLHLGRVLVVNHVLMPRLMAIAAASAGLALGKVPDRDDEIWDLIVSTLIGQYGCIFLAGAVGEGTLNALLSGKFDYRGHGLPVDGIVDLFQRLGITAHDVLIWNNDAFLNDMLGVMKSVSAPTRHAAQLIENWGTKKGEKRRKKAIRSWTR